MNWLVLETISTKQHKDYKKTKQKQQQQQQNQTIYLYTGGITNCEIFEAFSCQCFHDCHKEDEMSTTKLLNANWSARLYG